MNFAKRIASFEARSCLDRRTGPAEGAPFTPLRNAEVPEGNRGQQHTSHGHGVLGGDRAYMQVVKYQNTVGLSSIQVKV